MNTVVENLKAKVAALASTDPMKKSVLDRLSEVADGISAIEKVASEPKPATNDLASSDMIQAADAVGRLYKAAATTARNYERIMDILEGLHSAIKVAARPQNVAVRPKVASLVEKTAGVFALCDTVEDLDRPLEEIQKAVHSLYGDQSKNSTFYFDRRGKGHHSESK